MYENLLPNKIKVRIKKIKINKYLYLSIILMQKSNNFLVYNIKEKPPLFYIQPQTPKNI